MIKLINERTKEIVVFGDGIIDLSKIGCKNVAEMIEAGWEDYEEPKGIKSVGNIGSSVHIEMGSKEEAEKAVEKLKAWKRLQDKGFKVDLWDYDGGNYQERIRTGRILFRVKDCEEKENDKDLDLLFGGEE